MFDILNQLSCYATSTGNIKLYSAYELFSKPSQLSQFITHVSITLSFIFNFEKNSNSEEISEIP